MAYGDIEGKGLVQRGGSSLQQQNMKKEGGVVFNLFDLQTTQP